MKIAQRITPEPPNGLTIPCFATYCSCSRYSGDWPQRKKHRRAVRYAGATNFPNYPKENIRSKCNDHKVRGMQVNYKSAEKYVGNDELELLVLFPNGFAWEIRYNIDVR